jgi:hypothetical protein
MTDASTTGTQSKRGFFDETTFHKLLDWLDGGEDSQGRKYIEMRRRLVSYFERKRCQPPDDLADETLDRVARRLQEEGAINSPTAAQYVYIVARFVLLEYRRKPDRDLLSFEDLLNRGHDPGTSSMKPGDVTSDERDEKRLNCLEHCLQSLEAENRELIFNYYVGERRVKIENRKALAARLRLTPNALNIRACRIRGKLEICVNQCMAATKGFSEFRFY